MTELPLAPIERIMRKHTQGMQISQEAKTLFTEILEQEGKRISRKAIKLAQKDGRKTIQAKDIEKWVKPEEIDTNDFIYKIDENIYYNKCIGLNCFTNKDKAMCLPVKFLENKLLFRHKLHDCTTETEAQHIMESYENEILDSLMEPHWKYNIYEYRDWETPQKVNDHITKFSMWFDDYDSGDMFFEGLLFK